LGRSSLAKKKSAHGSHDGRKETGRGDILTPRKMINRAAKTLEISNILMNSNDSQNKYSNSALTLKDPFGHLEADGIK